MAKANVDPEELMQFAKALARYQQTVSELTAELRGKMRRLESSWKDQEQQKFAEAFEHNVKSLNRFGEQAEEHVRLLAAKAKHIEQYLGRR
ncbi:MAG: WXG100 family type VII secretion target [Planctomycetota bacterium]